MYTFRDKYFALPGDMRNAYDFWGTLNGCTNADTNTTPAGCNGNGNGIFNNSANKYHENARFWQHLASAGLIEGTYTGLQNASSPYFTIGSNIPATKLSNVGIGVGHNEPGAYGGSTYWGTHIDGNVFFIGTIYPDAPRAAAFSPEEVWNIDTKLDDGRPGTGWVISEPYLTNCHNGTDPATSTYQLNSSGTVCAIRALMR